MQHTEGVVRFVKETLHLSTLEMQELMPHISGIQQRFRALIPDDQQYRRHPIENIWKIRLTFM